MNIIYWVIFGLIAGSIANYFIPGSKGGIVGSIILGIVGGVIGGFLGERIFGVGVTGFNVSSLVVAVLGSALVIFAGRALMRA